jgi:hypothetical protein
MKLLSTIAAVLITFSSFSAMGEEKEMVLKVKKGVIVSEFNSTQNIDLTLVQTDTVGNRIFRKKALAMLEMGAGAYLGGGGVAVFSLSIIWYVQGDWFSGSLSEHLMACGIGALVIDGGVYVFRDGMKRWKKAKKEVKPIVFDWM